MFSVFVLIKVRLHLLMLLRAELLPGLHTVVTPPFLYSSEEGIPHSTGYRGTWYLIFINIQGYREQGTRYKVQSTGYKIQGTRYTGYRVQGTT